MKQVNWPPRKLPTPTLKDRRHKTKRKVVRHQSTAEAVPNLQDLPELVLSSILSYLSYHEVALLRVVSRKFNSIGQAHLNSGFLKAKSISAALDSYFNAQLPKRPSERTGHPLCDHADVLRQVDFKLQYSYVNEHYLERGMICYFAGKLLDEMLRLLRLLRLQQPLPRRWYELTTELSDLSGMATNHYRKVLGPILRKELERSQSPKVSLKEEVQGLKDEMTSLRNENKELKERLKALEEKLIGLLGPEKKSPALAEKAFKKQKAKIKPEPTEALPKSSAATSTTTARSRTAAPSKPRNSETSRAGRRNRDEDGHPARGQDDPKPLAKRPRRAK